VAAAYRQLEAAHFAGKKRIHADELSELLGKANRACELLQSDVNNYPWALQIKAALHTVLGQETFAVAAFRKVFGSQSKKLRRGHS